MNRFGHKKLVILLAAVILLAYASTAMAVDNINDLNQEINKQPVSPTGHSMVWDFVKMVLVLGVIVGAAWSIVRMFGKKATTRMQGTWLHTVDEVMLGQNRGLVLCEVAGKIYAIGVTDHNINLLFEVDNPQILKEIGEGNYTRSESPDVMGDLTRRVGNLIKHKKAGSDVKDFHALMTEQSNRLKIFSEKRILSGKVNRKNGEDD
jgi:flagellar protein FliO/FliZ